MKNTFGEAYTSLSPRMRGPGSEFTQCFEQLISQFDDTRKVYRLPLKMKSPGSEDYDENDRSVILHRFLIPWVTKEDYLTDRSYRNELRNFFETSLEKIIGLLEQQLNAAALMNNRKPQVFFRLLLEIIANFARMCI